MKKNKKIHQITFSENKTYGSIHIRSSNIKIIIDFFS